MSTKTATPQPKIDLDVTRERLIKVGLPRAAEQLDGFISEAVQGNTSPHRFLDRLLEEEMREAARQFEFERAAALRDRVKKLKKMEMEFLGSDDS